MAGLGVMDRAVGRSDDRCPCPDHSLDSSIKTSRSWKLTEFLAPLRDNARRFINNTMLLKDKVAVITGSATGIGNETARLFAKQGAALALIDRNRGANDATAAELTKAGVK